jgi:hypothetical protein
VLHVRTPRMGSALRAVGREKLTVVVPVQIECGVANTVCCILTGIQMFPILVQYCTARYP